MKRNRNVLFCRGGGTVFCAFLYCDIWKKFQTANYIHYWVPAYNCRNWSFSTCQMSQKILVWSLIGAGVLQVRLSAMRPFVLKSKRGVYFQTHSDSVSILQFQYMFTHTIILSTLDHKCIEPLNIKALYVCYAVLIH